MARITTNDLLDAVIAAAPVPPGPEWKTALELAEQAGKRGHKLGKSAMVKRLKGLVDAGKLETMRAPRRDAGGTGWSYYYRLKKAKR